jgi:hypothetical protein
MACSQCRREVTAEQPADAAAALCAACQAAALGDGAQAYPSGGALAADAASRTMNPALAPAEPWHSSASAGHLRDDPRALLDDPDLADDLRRARRLLRIDAAQQEHQPLGLAALLNDEPAPHGRQRRQNGRQAADQPAAGALLAWLWDGTTWLIVCGGGMALAFGGGLLTCSRLLTDADVTKRDDLWNWGLLTALAGQFFLFLGVALRLAIFRPARARPVSAAGDASPAANLTAPLGRSSTAPPWSARCEAVLGLSLETPDR